MANVLERYTSRRRNRSSNSSKDSKNSPEKKKAKGQVQNSSVEEEGDNVLTALTMSENVSRQLEQILGKLTKLDSIENALEKIETKLENLESRTKVLEDAQHGNQHEIAVMKDNIKMKKKNLEDITAKQAASEAELANFTRQKRIFKPASSSALLYETSGNGILKTLF